MAQKLLPPALLLAAAGATPAAAQCMVWDVSYQIGFDCSNTTWQGLVNYSWNGFSGTYGLGAFTSGNVCDPGGLNCDGSSRSFKLYQGTKSMQSYTDPFYDQEVTLWWNVNDQYLQWESCQFNDQPANRVTNYSFTHSTGWYGIWCD
jgi:hypothetical protein